MAEISRQSPSDCTRQIQHRQERRIFPFQDTDLTAASRPFVIPERDPRTHENCKFANYHITIVANGAAARGSIKDNGKDARDKFADALTSAAQPAKQRPVQNENLKNGKLHF